MNGPHESQMSEDAPTVSPIILIDYQKKCRQCEEIKTYKSFYPYKRSRDKYDYICKKCDGENRKNYSLRNIEKEKEKRIQYYKDNTEKVKKIQRLWRKNNPEKIKEGHANYRKNNKEKCDQIEREWRDKNKERVNKNNRDWSKNNPEKTKEMKRRYILNNPEKVKEIRIKYRENNKEKIKNRERKWAKEHPEIVRERNKKRRSNPKNRLSSSISCNIRHSIKKGSKGRRGWETLVGYTIDQLKKHLEKQFKDGMSWENYGHNGWHLDHIIPISVFNYSTPEDNDFKECWKLKNLQPLWEAEN